MVEYWKNGKTKERNYKRTHPIFPAFHDPNLPFLCPIIPVFQSSILPVSSPILPVLSFGSQVRRDVNFSLSDFFYGGEKFRIRVFL